MNSIPVCSWRRAQHGTGIRSMIGVVAIVESSGGRCCDKFKVRKRAESCRVMAKCRETTTNSAK